jgi:predicted metal-dependent phosphoesterase TrpH
MHRTPVSSSRLLTGSLLALVAMGAVTAVAVAAGSAIEPGRSDTGSTLLGIEVRDAQTRAALPARVRVLRTGWWTDRRVLLTDHGRTGVKLAAGEYEIIASHGPNWSIAREPITLRGEARRSLVLSLRREVDTGSYRACDLHVHTDQSPDSKASLRQRARGAQAEDLQLAVITDHNRATPVSSVQAEVPPSLALVQGVEVTSWAPEFGHFNAFPSTRAPHYKRTSPDQLLSELSTRGATFLQINHPRLLPHIGYFELRNARDPAAASRTLQGFDGLEVWNGYDLNRTDRRDRVMTDWLGAIGRGQHIVATGGSDSHDLSRNVLGYPRTYVREPTSAAPDPKRIVAALKAGRAFVSNGPLLELAVDGKNPGDTLALGPTAHTVRVTVRVDAPSWMDITQIELWVNGRPQLTATIEPWAGFQKLLSRLRAVRTFELKSAGIRSIVAAVRGERPMDELFDRQGVRPFAFTNPVWITRK